MSNSEPAALSPGKPVPQDASKDARPPRSKLGANILWLYGLQGLNYLIPVVLLPYLVRVLGVEQFGLIAFSQSIAQYFVIITDYGFNYSATRHIASHRDQQHEVSRMYWLVTSIKTVLLVLGAALIALAVLFFPRLHRDGAVYFAAYLTVVGNVIFPQWLFQGLERMRSISIITGIAKVLSAALIFLFVHNHQDLLLAAVLQSSGMVIAGIIGTVVAVRLHVGPFALPRRHEVIATLREGGHLFLVSAAVSLYTNTNTFLVGIVAGNVQAGYFSLAERLIRAINGLLNPVMQAAYPHTVRLIAESRSKAIRFIQKLVCFSGGFAALASGVLLFFAKPLAVLAFKGDAPAVVPILRALSLFPIAATVSSTLGVQALIPFGFDRVQSRLLLAAGIVNVAIGLLLIPRIGALGAVFSMTFIEAMLVVGNLTILGRGGVHLLRRTAAK